MNRPLRRVIRPGSLVQWAAHPVTCARLPALDRQPPSQRRASPERTDHQLIYLLQPAGIIEPVINQDARKSSKQSSTGNSWRDAKFGGPTKDPLVNLPTARTSREYPAVADSPLICFSHLRWDFVVQRPQHLMQRFARSRRVYFFEEWIPTDHHLPYLEFHRFADTEVVAVRPRVPHDWHGSRLEAALSALLDELLWVTHSTRPILWFYTPMMYALAAHVDAAAVVYDCMDVLANFRFAPADLTAREAELMKRADLLFTGGHSIFEEKRKAHRDVYAFPSSVDVEHFAAARRLEASPPAGKVVLGYYGVID